MRPFGHSMIVVFAMLKCTVKWHGYPRTGQKVYYM
jgi:hypothetical protein